MGICLLDRYGAAAARRDRAHMGRITGREASSSSEMEVVAAAHRRRKPVAELLTPNGEGESVSSTAARHSPKDPSYRRRHRRRSAGSSIILSAPLPGAVTKNRGSRRQLEFTTRSPTLRRDRQAHRSSDRRASRCIAPTLPWPAASTYRPPLAKSGVANVQEMRGLGSN
nr:hypothetical protein Iba_chr06bCG13450 [Ipomoea batatas]